MAKRDLNEVIDAGDEPEATRRVPTNQELEAHFLERLEVLQVLITSSSSARARYEAIACVIAEWSSLDGLAPPGLADTWCDQMKLSPVYTPDQSRRHGAGTTLPPAASSASQLSEPKIPDEQRACPSM